MNTSPRKILRLPRAGDRMRVRDCRGSYPLPKEIPQAAIVTIVSFDTGYFKVAYDEREFQVSMTCVHDL
jgi:hypothetical protein